MNDCWGSGRKPERVNIIVVGLLGSGKTTAAKVFLKYDFALVSSGDFIRDICRERGISTTRQDLQRVGAEFVEKIGIEEFVRRLVERGEGDRGTVFDGIRYVAAIDLLRTNYGRSVLMYIDAPLEAIRERLRARGEPERSFESIFDTPMESQVRETRGRCDILIDNSASLSEYISRIDGIAKSIVGDVGV